MHNIFYIYIYIFTYNSFKKNNIVEVIVLPWCT